MQILLNMLCYGMDPQTALDAPRLCITDGTADGSVAFEDGVSPDVMSVLAGMGHRVIPRPLTGYARSTFGRGQIILRDRETGVLWGASDGRGDGCAMGW